MADTPVCAHGWPIFDAEPCPDCLREIERAVTGAVTEPLPAAAESDDIPEFLRRKPGTEAGPGVGGASPQTPVGSDPVTTPPVAPDLYDSGPGCVSRRYGVENPTDVAMREQLTRESTARSKNKAETRLTRAGFKAGREGEYADGRTWDVNKARWV